MNVNTYKEIQDYLPEISQFSSSQNVTFPDDVESVAMSGYSDYLMSASSSIADIVNSASTAAASAAGQVAYQVSQIVIITSFLYECRLLSVDDVTTITHCFVKVSDACHSVAQSAQQKFLSYKYEPGKASGRVLAVPELQSQLTSLIFWSAGALDCDMEEVSIYPDTDSPVWLLGHQLSAKYDLAELRELVLTRPWMTYRRDFPPIGESGLTSDQVSSEQGHAWSQCFSCFSWLSWPGLGLHAPMWSDGAGRGAARCQAR